MIDIPKLPDLHQLADTGLDPERLSITPNGELQYLAHKATVMICGVATVDGTGAWNATAWTTTPTDTDPGLIAEWGQPPDFPTITAAAAWARTWDRAERATRLTALARAMTGDQLAAAGRLILNAHTVKGHLSVADACDLWAALTGLPVASIAGIRADLAEHIGGHQL